MVSGVSAHPAPTPWLASPRLLFAAVALCVGAAWELPAFLLLTGVGVLLAVVDLRHCLLPDRVLLPAGIAGLLLLTAAAAAEGSGRGCFAPSSGPSCSWPSSSCRR